LRMIDGAETVFYRGKMITLCYAKRWPPEQTTGPGLVRTLMHIGGWPKATYQMPLGSESEILLHIVRADLLTCLYWMLVQGLRPAEKRTRSVGLGQ
jgi:hypothetical protein